jgi:hypothetical protein
VRRIIGFSVHAGTVDGVALCRMFRRAIRGQRWLPKYLSPGHDPLYTFHQWQANLRILEVTEIKTVPYVPPVSSLRGKAHWRHSPRIFGSHVVLDECRSGE